MQKQFRFSRRLLQACLLIGVASATQSAAAAAVSPGDAYQSVIASPARTDADKTSDARRKPAAFLAFAEVQPGMKVLDLFSGGGATSELLALAVGEKGEVWAQDPAPSDALAKRLAAHPQSNLHPVVAKFEDPVPAGTPSLDLITLVMNYHDIVNTPTNREAMNRRLYAALKPGGHFVVIDNAAKPGSGLSDTNTLHRIDEAALIAEVTKAGFVIDDRSDYLHVADDPHDQPYYKMNGRPDDKFALRFVKK